MHGESRKTSGTGPRQRAARDDSPPTLKKTFMLAPADAEVVTDFPGNPRQVTIPRVQFNCGTTLESPCFWFAAGMLSAFAILYFLRK